MVPRKTIRGLPDVAEEFDGGKAVTHFHLVGIIGTRQ